ncbi:MAG: DUF1700 domain-containing protein [Lachnospiraceae bacterium]|nr:DUF1700 domain-containing protein [Lachnospiraceae bacterium]
MTRAEFMKRLAELLNDVSPSEREEAIQYYNDYFDDAGEENEQGVIASLGTPEAVAKTIKAGLADGGSVGEFTEKGFNSYEAERTNEVMNPQQDSQQEAKGDNQNSYDQKSYTYSGYENPYKNAQTNNQQSYGQQSTEIQPKKKKMSGFMIALIVILCIFASPVLIGIAGGLFGVLVGILGALFGIIIGFGAAAVSLIVVGICLFVYGITLLFGTPLGGLCLMGIAMVCVAIGLIFLWLTVLICGGLIPAIVRGIVKLFQKIFHRGGAKA